MSKKTFISRDILEILAKFCEELFMFKVGPVGNFFQKIYECKYLLK